MKVKRRPTVELQLTTGSKSLQEKKIRVELSTWDIPGNDMGIGVYVFQGDEMLWHGMLTVTVDIERFVKLFGSFLPITHEHKRVIRNRTSEGDEEKAKGPRSSQEKKDRARSGKGNRTVVVRKKRTQR